MFQLILKKYLQFVPLWSMLLIKNKRKSNAVTDNNFGHLKKLLWKKKKIKCSVYKKGERRCTISLNRM